MSSQLGDFYLELHWDFQSWGKNYAIFAINSYKGVESVISLSITSMLWGEGEIP